MPSLALQGLLADLTRDFHGEQHDQSVDVLQYCADWFQTKLRTEASLGCYKRATAQPAVSGKVGPTLALGSSRKFPNFPTMSLPQAPLNVFQSHLSQPSPFSEHGPTDSPFGGGGLLSQRRATLANTGTIGPQAGSNASSTSHHASIPVNYSMGFPPTKTQHLPQLAEEGSIDEDSPMSNSQPGVADAPSSFASFTFDEGAAAPAREDASPFERVKFPPQASSSGTAQASSDELRPPSYALGRRTSVSAESLVPNDPAFAAGHLSGPLAEQRRDDGPATSPQPVKTDMQLQRIRHAIGQNFLFRNLDEEQERDVLAAMREVQVQPGEVVIQQGAAGDFFYVIESGEFDIFKRENQASAESQVDGSENRGNKVHTAGPGGSFGELALMYNAPRAASVVAKGEATLWALDRISFRTILLDHTSRKRRMYETFLTSVPILASLEGYERAKIADALESRTFQSGEQVIQEGESGDEFYIIESGTALVEKADAGMIGELKRGDYFGELALLNRAPRAATVKAGGVAGEKLRVAALGEKAFTRLLGPVREIMARKAGEMYGLTGAYRS